MDKCVICGREIKNDSHFLIQSRGEEINFYSRDCVDKYVAAVERLFLLDYHQHRTSFYLKENDKRKARCTNKQDLYK